MEEHDIEKINILKMTYPRESIYYKVLEKLLQAYKQDEKIIKEIAKAWKQDDIRSVEEIIDYFRKRCE